ncbi:MAG TPA: sodium:proton antiporter [Desulfobacteraceae bacterium]|nr:sodium:proton antiporter [Desulfobacteraceae bacterium]|tara:strand:+ start:796 stop:2334 length:1539 start_codon:yes stop_codon:yes gene_type:complete
MKLDKLAIYTPLFIIFLALFYLPQGTTTVFASEGQGEISHYTLEVQPQGSGGHGQQTDHGDGGHHGHANLGEELPLYSCIPFACMLLSIALLPLVAGAFWHHHFGKISAFWAACLAIPFVAVYKGQAVYEILHIILADYVPFIILLWALFTVSGGILLRGKLRGTPIVNTVIILIGTILASWMGTTGAAMLLIRPFLRANAHRKNKTFMVVFFIFLVANIGGALTPLGDPPLFLGFLHGVTFFWTMKIMPHMVLASGILLVVYFLLDSFYYRKEAPAPDDGEKAPLRLVGTYNFIFLAGVVGAVLMSGILNLGDITTLGVHRAAQDWLRDGLLIVFGILSLWVTPRTLREENEFTWFPIVEVAYLFIGIFITMIPCLLLLKAGSKGAFAFLINAVQEPVHYFWVTGMLSAFLDNAPTYLTFFNTALGSFYAGMTEAQSVPLLMTENAIYLAAVSAGAVFFGACSYIGNAPNFMVRSIAAESGVDMPSFFGYILKYSLVFLIPVFVVVTLVFF